MDPVVRTSRGRVRGLAQDGLSIFLGIPFAAAPDGPLRFELPAPAAPWDGVRDADVFGVAPPQLLGAPYLPAGWRPRDGLDCLTVNVWTPAVGASGLPVMVWIYGGAWKAGCSSQPAYDGSKLASAGVVFVSFNYRVGFEGFGQLPDAPANRWLHDQVAALSWVQENIAAFGGEAGNVTVFGESAGAGSIAALIAAPVGRGLFRRAIAQSIPRDIVTIDEAERVTRLLAAEAGIAATRAGFATLPPEAILAVQDAPLKGPEDGISAFAPVIDGEIITAPPWAAIREGAGREIDLICGFMHEEWRLVTAGADLSSVDLAGVARALNLAPDGVSAYRAAYPGRTDAELFTVMLSDAIFRMPTTWVAEAHAHAGGRTWLYDFTWQSPSLGACHALDVAFTFGHPETAMAVRLLGDPPPDDFAALSQEIRDAWVAFAATGAPGWPCFELEHRRTRIWDNPSTDTAYPLADSRRIWEHVTPQ